jgi:hypothetical protein
MLQPGLSTKGEGLMHGRKAKVVLAGLASFIVVSSSLGLGLVRMMGQDGGAGGPTDGPETIVKPLVPKSEPAELEMPRDVLGPDTWKVPGEDWPIGPALVPDPVHQASPAGATPADEPVASRREPAVPSEDGATAQTSSTGGPTPGGEDAEGQATSGGTNGGTTAGGNESLGPGGMLGDLINPADLLMLAELEGLREFSMSGTPYSTSYSFSAPGGIGSGEAGWGPNDPGSTNRTYAEPDIVELDGDTLYLLNAFRGLIIVDLEDPDEPVFLGSAPVLGNPVDMYIIGTRAYVIVTCTYDFWYNYGRGTIWPGLYWPYYPICSRLVIVDIANSTDPRVLIEYPIEGLVSDSRRVGDVLYYVATCDAWYNGLMGSYMEDQTYVLSVGIADPWNVTMVDTVTFEGNTQRIYATAEHLYLSDYDPDAGYRGGACVITLLDISDPDGDIVEKGLFTVDGQVLNRYQMDEYADTFRVVSHFDGFLGGKSELNIFDISNASDVRQLSRLVIDDDGNLMATRFAGDRAYTIHLWEEPPAPAPTPAPRVPPKDPLDVVDLSDPNEPVLCDVLEIPGWVTHMEVRGYEIIALGVEENATKRNVTLSLFNVTDPWNAVMQDRVWIGGHYGTSIANIDPKALTVLDDVGLVLVPFTGQKTDPNGWHKQVFGVQIISFDLGAGGLVLRGSFEHPEGVSRTRASGGQAISTSRSYLTVADLSDLDTPVVTASVYLCPEILDYRDSGDHYIEVVSSRTAFNLSLRGFVDGQHDLNPPVWELDLGAGVDRWFWQDDWLHVLSSSYSVTGTWYLTVTTYDMTGKMPTPQYVYTFMVGDPSYHFQIRSWMATAGGWWYSDSNLRGGIPNIDNPVLLDGGTLALFLGNKLFLVNLCMVHTPRPGVPIYTWIMCDGFAGLISAGGNLFIVTAGWDGEDPDGGHDHSKYWYYVTRVEVGGESVVSTVGPVKVPGCPVGAATDGSLFFTMSSWPLRGTLVTLNVMELVEGGAVLLHAYNLTNRTFLVAGDIAVICEVLEDRATMPGGLLISSRSTLVYVIDLVDSEVVNGCLIPDVYAPRCAYDGVALLANPGGCDIAVIGLDASDETVIRTSMAVIGGLTMLRCGDKLYVVQGRYGVQAIDLA